MTMLMLRHAGVVPEKGLVHGEALTGRPVVGRHRTTPSLTQTSPETVSGPQAARPPAGPHGDSLRAPDRGSVGVAAPRDGLWLRDDVLAAPAGLAAGWRLAATPSGATGPTPSGRATRLVTGHCRLDLDPGAARGKKTGPSPTDRRKLGSQHHLVTDGHGIPLAAIVTEANRHDVTQLRGDPPGPREGWSPAAAT